MEDAHELLCTPGTEDRIDEAVELALEIRIAHRPLEAADRMRDEEVQRPAVGEGDGDVGGVFRDGASTVARMRSRNAITSARDDERVGEFGLARAAEQQTRRARVVDAELRLESSARRPFAGELEHQRVHFQIDARDGVGPQLVRVAQLHTAVDAGWMTMPQANGLYELNEISKRSPSASVISFQSHFVE